MDMYACMINVVYAYRAEGRDSMMEIHQVSNGIVGTPPQNL